MASNGKILEAAKTLLLAGFLAGCSGGVAGLMDVPPAGPDASSSGADSLVAAVADASQTRIDAPAVQPAAPGPRDASPDGADGASLAQADVSAATEDAGSLDDA